MATQKKLNIVIFGATGSIGYFTLKKFYENNHNLLLFIKNNKKIKFLKKKFKPSNLQTIKFENLDILDKKSLKKKIDKNKNFIKKANLIINAIGDQGQVGNFFKLDLKKFDKTFKINFFSQIFLLRNIYKFIKKNKDTLIILFAGGGVTSVRRNFSSYSLSKIASVKLSEILSHEFNNKNIRINSISPGVIDSKMTRLILGKKKFLDKKEIVKLKKGILDSKKSLNKVYNLINFLMSKKGKFVSGKIISSRWDAFENWKKKEIKKIKNTDIFTLRRNINL